MSNKRMELTSSLTVNKYKRPSIDDYLMHISQVSGLRFQPIVSLSNGEVIAQEVLSAVAGDAESFFSSLPEELHLAIFLWQLEEISHLPECYWFNLPVALLSEPYLISELIASGPAKNNVSIELQDPENIQYLNPLQYNRLRSGVRRLQQHGWNIILDDLTSNCTSYLNPQNFQFAAVKFDRSELRDSPKLVQQVQNARNLAPLIVLEGIETADDLNTAKSCHADVGQGFFWPERKVKCYVPETIARQALLWSQRLEIIRKQRVTINTTISNTYFRLGVIHLLCDIDLTEPDGMISFADISHRTDLNIIFSDAGPICLSCQRYLDRWNNKPATFTLAFIDQQKQTLNELSCINQVVPMQQPVGTIRHSLSSSIHSLYRKKCDNEGAPRSSSYQCRIHSLTTNERDVMHLTGSGCTPSVIATRLGYSVKVVSKHRRSAMRKLGMDRSTDFIRMSCAVSFLR